MNRRPITRAAVVCLLAPFLLLISAFPYIQIIPSGSYTQPQAYILGLLLFFFSFEALYHLRPLDKLALFGLSLVGTVLFLVTCFPYEEAQEYKYLLAYLGPILLIPVFIRILKKMPRETIGILQGAISIWLLVSLIQFLVAPQFATFLLGDWGGHALDIVSSGRGVLGLAPEPTHNAFHTLLLGAVLALLDHSRLSRVLALGCIFSAVFLAASSSAILVLLVAVLLWLLRHKFFWGVVLLAVGAVFLNMAHLIPQDVLHGDSRAIVLLDAFLEDPTGFLVADYSVNMRLGGLIAIFLDTVQSGFLPHGLAHASWLQARTGLLSDYEWLIDLSSVGPPSGFGLLLFQGGFLMFPFLFVFVYRLYKKRMHTIAGEILVLAVPFIFLSQFYTSSPMFSMVYACVFYRGPGRQNPIRQETDRIADRDE